MTEQPRPDRSRLSKSLKGSRALENVGTSRNDKSHRFATKLNVARFVCCSPGALLVCMETSNLDAAPVFLDACLPSSRADIAPGSEAVLKL